MSLINDALKKAQKQRTGEAPPLASMPAIGGESATHIARRAKPASLNTLLVRLGIGAGVLVMVLVAAILFFTRKPTESAPVSGTKSVAAAQAAAPATPAPTPAATKASETAFVLPIAPQQAAAKPAPVTSPKAEPATPAAPVATPEPAKVEPARPPAPAARLEPRAITFIESIRVAGIRASATDSKVLMNDRVYRIGNVVEPEMGLRLVEITANSLTFEDERGGRYTRHF
jgi:hypothetical protein